MFVIVIIELFLKTPPFEKPEPARHVNQVAALVHAVFLHVVKQLLIFFHNDSFIFFGWLS